MKLKHLAAFLVLLAIGCTQQPSSDSTTPVAENEPAAPVVSDPADDVAAKVEPETETQLASTTVNFDVTGMS